MRRSDRAPSPLKRFFDRHPEITRPAFAAECTAERGHIVATERLSEWCYAAPGPVARAMLARVTKRHGDEVTERAWAEFIRRATKSGQRRNPSRRLCAARRPR